MTVKTAFFCTFYFVVEYSLGLLFILYSSIALGFPGGSDSKESSAMQENQVLSLGEEDLLKKEMTTHSSMLAWRIPWTEELGGLQSRELQRVGHD